MHKLEQVYPSIGDCLRGTPSRGWSFGEAGVTSPLVDTLSRGRDVSEEPLLSKQVRLNRLRRLPKCVGEDAKGRGPAKERDGRRELSGGRRVAIIHYSKSLIFINVRKPTSEFD